MKKGSLVKIKQSANPKLMGTCGLVVRLFHCIIDGCDYVVIHRFVDGREDSYHKTRLEFLV
jgi:hypothetical protein